MELRHLENIVVEKAIIHVIDKSLPEPLYSQTLIETPEIVEDLIPQHIVKVLKNFDNYKGRFDEMTDGSEHPVRETISSILDENPYFVADTATLARAFYKAVCGIDNIENFDLLMAVISAEGEKMLAIMKLDYQMNYVHDVTYDNENVKIDIVSQHTGLPTSRQQLTNCAVIMMPGRYDYDMMVLNRKEKDDDGNLVDYFVEGFLGTQKYYDSTTKTIALGKCVEAWIRKSVKDDVAKAEECRNFLSTLLTEHAMVNVVDLVYKITDKNDEKDLLEERLATAGIAPGESFEIDKKWVEKKLKLKQFKTDTGFVLKAEKEFFSDKARFESIINGDGSMTYIIKNVRNIAAK